MISSNIFFSHSSESRSSHRRCSVRKGVLRISQNSQENTCEPATLLKKRLWYRCFPVNYVKFLRTPFSRNTSGRLPLNVDLNTARQKQVSQLILIQSLEIKRFQKFGTWKAFYSWSKVFFQYSFHLSFLQKKKKSKAIQQLFQSAINQMISLSHSKLFCGTSFFSVENIWI